ncbi:hypothetical protein ACGFY9_24870 [Streptomyces sp. NPDC048504]|uniref:hypothetical protein n=1 Tax=Streptomyces sp. NPDC048504 TaxID=3365559 RepID=UPI00372213DB
MRRSVRYVSRLTLRGTFSEHVLRAACASGLDSALVTAGRVETAEVTESVARTLTGEEKASHR